jgi:hypothetical protein
VEAFYRCSMLQREQQEIEVKRIAVDGIQWERFTDAL